MAVLYTAHLFELSREDEYMKFCEADRDHIPIRINNSENGLLLCPNCHTYVDRKPRLLGIKPNGTIQLFGLAKDQNYKELQGKKVPWWENINKKDWPTSALLDVVYKLPPKSKKRKGVTDLDQGIVDATDLSVSTTSRAMVSKPVRKRHAVSSTVGDDDERKEEECSGSCSACSTSRRCERFVSSKSHAACANCHHSKNQHNILA